MAPSVSEKANQLRKDTNSSALKKSPLHRQPRIKGKTILNGWQGASKSRQNRDRTPREACLAPLRRIFPACRNNAQDFSSLAGIR